ncbi:F-box protein with a domain protein [Actinidia rufa]|uniref:F-box protein with a domain protein n=1 Tax=Actinidia rufa TaxID=165716 RepID=A0A7J0EZC6_9ERIC|nr:F-box protein with a domain protein [Actinidia rufa]
MNTKVFDPMMMVKLYVIMEAISDRVEMHKNIREQRNNWNSLLSISIKTITLTISIMIGIAAMSGGGDHSSGTQALFNFAISHSGGLRKSKRQVLKGFGGRKNNSNGWDSKLEDELKEINMVSKRKDEESYLRLGGKALKLNKALASSLLTDLVAVGYAFVGTPSCGSWAVVLRIIAGVLSSVVNTLEHGVQVGIVFEMY